ncbi:MAG: tRNA (adenosine(37)-N6)-threonylcarbamoyltransferase complex dimerization subunit type 1 TsaB [Elusimicrobia bacterium]|nr:tRNA (adenosine(37)-N6)-threonylcarbamoyltransferase complex dimerization subunit type 1 TsaB [Elusimicrobiota bacterium]
MKKSDGSGTFSLTRHPRASGGSVNAIALETSGTHLSFAVWRQGRLAAKTFIDAKWDHEKIFWRRFPETLRRAGLKIKNCDFFAVTRGPGRFTGTRLGLAIINTWAHLYKKPVFAPTVQELMAWQCAQASDFRLQTSDFRFLCIVAFSGAFTAARVKPDSRISPIKVYADLKNLFAKQPKSKKEPPALLYYVQYNLESEIKNLAEKYGYSTVKQEIPKADALALVAASRPKTHPAWIRPPKLPLPLYLKQNWG